MTYLLVIGLAHSLRPLGLGFAFPARNGSDAPSYPLQLRLLQPSRTYSPAGLCTLTHPPNLPRLPSSGYLLPKLPWRTSSFSFPISKDDVAPPIPSLAKLLLTKPKTPEDVDPSMDPRRHPMDPRLLTSKLSPHLLYFLSFTIVYGLLYPCSNSSSYFPSSQSLHSPPLEPLPVLRE